MRITLVETERHSIKRMYDLPRAKHRNARIRPVIPIIIHICLDTECDLNRFFLSMSDDVQKAEHFTEIHQVGYRGEMSA